MTTKFSFYAAVLCLAFQTATAQDVRLHVNPRWEQCSFQLDPTLTHSEWREFTHEAAMVAFFRPVVGARAMGKGRIEISAVQWNTTIDETKGAWNNTFVHPHDKHYLVGGPVLPFPGLTLRTGVTDKLDAGVYLTKSFGANYGFAGAQVQYQLLNDEPHKVDVSTRLGFNTLYGPKDMRFMVTNLDVLASKKITIHRKWLSVTPYAGASVYLSHSHEKSDLLSLPDANVIAPQAMAGAVVSIRNFNLGIEYNMAVVNTLSYRVGYNFKIW